uniref:Major facilitator superfamily (MFS) profile domain-containing protein n=1 Tax=Auxenochlorella protothecoides TaxID=3075 RepID=A0A1D1ZV67_AUXPR
MPLNHNVKLTFWWSWFENLSASVRSGDALSAYIYLISRRTSTVGIIQGINGISQLAAAVPAGYLCDILRRDMVLRSGAVLGLLAAGTLATTMSLAPTIVNLAACAGLLGIYRGIHSVAMESIFADSVEAGRSSLYTKKYIVTVLAAGSGQLLSFFVFLRLGNRWRMGDCRAVVEAGLLLMLAPLVLMLFFNDDLALDHASEAVTLPDASGAPTSNAEGCTDGPDPELDMERNTVIDPGSELDFPLLPTPAAQPTSCCPPAVFVTLLLTLSDLLSGLASGMTVKFFAIFFLEQCRLRPATVAAVAAAAPCGVAFAAAAAQRIAARVGRVEVSICTRLFDVGLLSSMAFISTARAPAMLTVHLLRTALANSTRPLMRSVLMEVVPKQYRGKVNAFESITMFSWSGSAALGGVLIERLGFQATFLVTAAIKLAACVPVVVLCVTLRRLGLSGARDWRDGRAARR